MVEATEKESVQERLETLHEALSNSLNVPTVKTLEFIGLESFDEFLENDLNFTPIQSLDSYQYGIALGGLEMDLLTLSNFFTLFFDFIREIYTMHWLFKSKRNLYPSRT